MHVPALGIKALFFLSTLPIFASLRDQCFWLALAGDYVFAGPLQSARLQYWMPVLSNGRIWRTLLGVPRHLRPLRQEDQNTMSSDQC